MKNRVIHFIGIKGAGMAALARICYKLGYEVQGSDLSKYIFTQDELQKLDIPIYDFNAQNIKDNMSVVIGNAFQDDHEEVAAALANESVETYRYHEFLGTLLPNYRSVAVSGTHGKTTTTALLRVMLSYTKETGYLIGDGRGDLVPDDEYFALEACEYKRHFLAYKPDIAIMTSFEIDHVDYFKSQRDFLDAFEAFSENVKDLVIVWGDDPHYSDLTLNQKVMTYGLGEANDLQARNIENNETHSQFDVFYKDQFIHRFDLPIVGDHMVLNALAVIGVGIYDGIEALDMEVGLQEFKGAKRRFAIDSDETNIYIDDYAHHPTEIAVTLDAARKRYPDKTITAIFKPHRVGRLAHFADEFAQALSKADHVYLSPFTSIDDFEEGIDIDISYLQDRIPNSKIIENNADDIDDLSQHAPGVFVFMSSKDIYDLKDALKNRFN
ncbi:MAG TPA: UDP-N-acetylmuramate--L-alanine ligase [Erysipelothrix sp.]|nr:UDP-N-acetylmuramate--L-alanine ligase [Erysipelothrix sp.]